jgi:protein SCO1/2
LPDPAPAPGFTLTAAGGRQVSLNDFAGEIRLLYFGYTFCPDICPTSMADLAQVQREVDDDGGEVQAVMITVDPARDTPEVMANYVTSFHPDFVGLSGAPEEIADVAEHWGVFYEAQEGTAATGYLVDHTSRIFLVDQAGRYRLTYAFGTPVEDIVADVQILLREGADGE